MLGSTSPIPTGPDHDSGEDVTDDSRLAQPNSEHANHCGCNENERHFTGEPNIYHLLFTSITVAQRIKSTVGSVLQTTLVE